MDDDSICILLGVSTLVIITLTFHISTIIFEKENKKLEKIKEKYKKDIGRSRNLIYHPLSQKEIEDEFNKMFLDLSRPTLYEKLQQQIKKNEEKEKKYKRIVTISNTIKMRIKNVH